MKKAANQTTLATDVPGHMGVWAVWLILIDTSIRLFVPSVGGTILGIWLDKTMDTVPLFTITGVLIGTMVAFGLVYLQLRAPAKHKGTRV